MPRLFVGLELPERIKQQLLAIQRPISGARWQSAEQLHLTLRFLGNVEDPVAALIESTLATLKLHPFALAVKGVDCFGDPQHPRNLWAGVQPESPVKMLHDELNRRFETIGFAPERRPFKPHVTLSRFGRQAGSAEALLAAERELVSPVFVVEQLSLFESHQDHQGARYQVIGRYGKNVD